MAATATGNQIEVISPEFAHGTLTRVVKIKAKHQLLDHRGRWFTPKYASVTWTRGSTDDRWYVIKWEIYSDKGSTSGTRAVDAPDGAESIFRATRPKALYL